MSFQVSRIARIPLVVLTADFSSGTDGGASASGTWTTRPLNTKLIDTNSVCTLAANQFTPIAGTYRVRAWQVSYDNGGNQEQFQGRIRNITDSTTTFISESTRQHSVASVEMVNTLEGEFATPGGKTYELQYWVQTADAAGLGKAITSGETERYALVLLEKIA